MAKIQNFMKRVSENKELEEIQKTPKAAWKGEGELSDEALDTVAGGSNGSVVIEDCYKEIEKLLGNSNFDFTMSVPGQPINPKDFEYFE